MSDAELRELERRWSSGGDLEDEAAWLRARVRAGELDLDRLERAAAAGHEGAARALEREPGKGDLTAWLRGVEGLGGRRALVLVALAVYAWAEPGIGEPERPLIATWAFQAARDWLDGKVAGEQPSPPTPYGFWELEHPLVVDLVRALREWDGPVAATEALVRAAARLREATLAEARRVAWEGVRRG